MARTGTRWRGVRSVETVETGAVPQSRLQCVAFPPRAAREPTGGTLQAIAQQWLCDRIASRFYLAVARSAVPPSPIPRKPSLKCDLPKMKQASREQAPRRFVAIDMPRLGNLTCVTCREVDRGQDVGATAVVHVVCGSAACKRGSRSHAAIVRYRGLRIRERTWAMSTRMSRGGRLLSQRRGGKCSNGGHRNQRALSASS